MGQRSVTVTVSPSFLFRMLPETSKTCPLVTSPTGTLIGPPVSVTVAPRTRPSVGFRATVRTVESPRCCSTSRVISCELSPSMLPTLAMLTFRAL